MQDLILNLVTDHFKVSLSDIQQKSRRQIYVRPRFTAIYLLRKYTPISYYRLTSLFYSHFCPEHGSGKAIYANRMVMDCLRYSTWIYEDVQALEEKLQSTLKLAA